MTPRSILLVEDNAGDVRLTREALREADVAAALIAVPDGEQALAFLRREGEHADAGRPDLILLDLNLPKVDGREVLEKIKSDPKLRRVPVIALTSSTREEDVVRAYDLGVNTFISKPVKFEDFIRVIATIRDYWIVIATLPPMEQG